MADFETLRYSVANNIADIVLDRPPANLIDRKSALEYLAALDAADADAEVRVIVLSGAGRGLSGGADLKYLEAFDAAGMKAFLDLFYVGIIKRVRALTKPIIAQVHGYAREGACTLAFGCDMIVASEDADFGYPGVEVIGAPPGMHTWFLQKLIGRMKAAELIFTGDPIGAVEAERLGLITKVVPPDQLRAETVKLASRIAGMSPSALKISRDLLYRFEDMDFSEVPEAAVEVVSAAFDTADSKEARRAFNEKRKPVWSGA